MNKKLIEFELNKKLDKILNDYKDDILSNEEKKIVDRFIMEMINFKMLDKIQDYSNGIACLNDLENIEGMFKEKFNLTTDSEFTSIGYVK